MVHVFFHKADLDGFASCAIVRYAINEKLNMIGCHYGDSLDLSKFDKEDTVIMVDFSFSPEIMLKIKESVKEFIWIDHHKSAIANSEKNGYSDLPGLRDMEYAACELTWKYMMENETMPIAIQYLGRFDIWDHKDPKVLYFQEGMKSLKVIYPTLKDTRELWSRLIENDEALIQEILIKGQIIYEDMKTRNARLCDKNSYVIEFEGLRLLAVNQPNVNAKFFESKYDPKKHDAMCAFSYKPEHGKWVVSLYTTHHNVNILAVATKFGGGGHAKACGFSLNKEEIVKLLL